MKRDLFEEIMAGFKALKAEREAPVEEEEEEEDDDEGQPDEAQEWYDYDPDC